MSEKHFGGEDKQMTAEDLKKLLDREMPEGEEMPEVSEEDIQKTKEAIEKEADKNPGRQLGEFFDLSARVLLGSNPVHARCFFEPGHLPFRVLIDLCFKHFHHFLFCHFLLQILREVFVFKPQLLHALPRYSLVAEFFYFCNHAFFHACKEARIYPFF